MPYGPHQNGMLLTCNDHIYIANKWVLPFLIIPTFPIILIHLIFQMVPSLVQVGENLPKVPSCLTILYNSLSSSLGDSCIIITA